MTISITQQPDVAYDNPVTSLSNTFASQPTEGNLLVFNVVALGNMGLLTADDPSLVLIGSGYESARRIHTYAKIAGAAEASVFSFSLSVSNAIWIFATEYETTDEWLPLTTARHSVAFDSTGSESQVTTSLDTTVGSLLVATGYSLNVTFNNQQITSGYTDFIQTVDTSSRLTAQANKVAASEVESATFSTVDQATNNKFSIALAEFQLRARNQWKFHDDFVFKLGNKEIDLSNDNFELRLATSGSNVTDLSVGDATAVTNEVSVTGYSPQIVKQTWVQSGSNCSLDIKNPSITAYGADIIANSAYIVDTSLTPNLVVAHAHLNAAGTDETIPDGGTLMLEINDLGIGAL